MPDVDLVPRYADPNAVETAELPGPCRCPGSPHEHDTATWRTELGSGELAALEPAGWFYSPIEGMYSQPAFISALVAYCLRSWTILSGKLDDEGKPVPVPIEYASVALLDKPARDFLVSRINGAYKDRNIGQAPLPNGSGAPSPRSRSGSASRTRTSRKRR